MGADGGSFQKLARYRGTIICTVGTLAASELVQNEVAEPIHELIGKLDGWGHIPSLFRTIIDHRTAEYRPWKGRLSFLMDGRPLCWVNHKGRLSLGYSDEKTSTKAIFEVLSAERLESEAGTLRTSASPAPEPEQGRKIGFLKRKPRNDAAGPAAGGWETHKSRPVRGHMTKVWGNKTMLQV